MRSIEEVSMLRIEESLYAKHRGVGDLQACNETLHKPKSRLVMSHFRFSKSEELHRCSEAKHCRQLSAFLIPVIYSRMRNLNVEVLLRGHLKSSTE